LTSMRECSTLSDRNGAMNSQQQHGRYFPYRYERRLAPLWLPFRWGGDQGVTLTDDGRFVARYGPFRAEAPLSNVRDAHVTGPFRWWTAVGPRLSFVDDGLTFGTNAQAGVCIHFDPPVHRVIGFKDHSALTVTVADPEALAAALKAGLDTSD
jgi:hypothetical protein